MTTQSAITPFTIRIADADLEDLQRRLERTRAPHTLAGSGDTYGISDDFVHALANRWRDGYDWRAWEAKLNRYPQFVTEINGHPLHFFHIRSKVESATPLLLLHGWPGSVIEFLGMIDPLTDPEAHGGTAADAFHLVIPSSPGYGFSGPTESLGWTSKRVAETCAQLMARLGYVRYGAQGGDFGAFVGPELGRVDGEHVIGVHLNAATFGFIPFGELPEEELAALSEVERARYDRLQWWENAGSGYFKMQSTRPQTLAYALADSPVGLLAWISDMFSRGEIDADLILTNASIYWFTNTIASSIRYYYEDMHAGEWPMRSETPVGVAAFADDVSIRRYSEDL
ncbi:MAG: alpha/beta fold hydrolase, partial [Thermomicrobiales bacterium]|nr:alpha/beta fold hydrolase [Thermomicrobiales bacterium]